MEKPAGFLSAFFGSCSGTAIFFRLMNHSWKRVIWHSLLLSVLCGIAAGLSDFKATQNNVELLKSSFFTAFGKEVLIGKKTIVPKQNPEKPRSALLPAGGNLFYTGTGKGMISEKIPASLYSMIWRPEDLTIVSLQGEQEGMRFRFEDGKLSRLTNPDAKKLFLNDKVKREEERCVDFSLLLENVLPVLRFYFVLTKTLWFLLMSWLYTGMFVLVYRIFHASRLRNLTISSMWKCGIYAGFPSLAVATIWQVLALPFINYETVFMLGLLIYWMVVIARIEHSNPEEKNSNE